MEGIPQFHVNSPRSQVFSTGTSDSIASGYSVANTHSSVLQNRLELVLSGCSFTNNLSLAHSLPLSLSLSLIHSLTLTSTCISKHETRLSKHSTRREASRESSLPSSKGVNKCFRDKSHTSSTPPSCLDLFHRLLWKMA